LGLLPGCSRGAPSASSATQAVPNGAPSAASASGAIRYDALSRDEFNRRAAAHFLPLFWRADANHDRAIEPGEIAVLVGYPDSDVNRWIDQGGDFTQRFADAYASLLKPEPPPARAEEARRRGLLLEELAQGIPTLVETDLRRDSPEDRAMVRHLLRAGELIEHLYARQKGVFGLTERIPDDDLVSRGVFHRNQSPFCEAPQTGHDPLCTALYPRPPRIVGLYPADVQSAPDFCARLAAAPNAAALRDHFSIVVPGAAPGSFAAEPFSSAYRDDMEGVATALEAAARGFGEKEPAFTAYLNAAAQAFRTNEWEPADRAWVAMSSTNSKWYARIAPDEVYYDPCAWKAGFALQLARIDPQSLAWQARLDPLKQDMERALATLAGPPYRVRDVAFKLPDFIEVVLNAGDQRNPTGATVGESLPNWGPVAEHGGRTVVMTNIGTDPDSVARRTRQEESMFCAATQAQAGDYRRDSLLVSLLHEAAHNLGPAHDYAVDGKTDTVAFGGPLASMLEELKAENSSMYLTSWLVPRKVFSAAEAQTINFAAIAWTFGHIAQGMYAPDGTPRTYSQLAAIQLGSFIDSGAIAWKADEKAANGTDRGCLQIDFGRLPGAVETLERKVLAIKSRADRRPAEQLKARYVDEKSDAFAHIKDAIAARWQRAPQASFVYSLDF
ncbi:MAG TPA: hypothetical protein VEV18_08390, partial [Steroidobacteraceae bacterium]|nr:hypothetical protein [Steroidobacteraceae bacterium]